MQSGLLFRWGKPIVGREAEAVDLFGEVMDYFEKKKKDGTVTYSEPFLFSTTDLEIETGFLVVKGPVTEIFKMIDEDDYKTILAKASLLIGHFKVDFIAVGDAVFERFERYSKIRADLGV